MSTLPLFEEPPPELAARLEPRLRTLAAEGVYIGTSSWKYEGWIGQIYTRDRYTTRGRFSKARFEAECIEEYAKTFPVVCGDFSFYQFPSDIYWQRLFAAAPEPLLFAFKVPEDITVKRFPTHDRYGPRAGRENEGYLDADLFGESFLRPLDPFRARIAALIFEFGTFSHSQLEEEPFLERLDRFLAALPRTHRYAVEIRNRELLAPAYFACLRRHGVAHVFNAWARMPELSSQMALTDAYTADFDVVRALLRPGRSYEEAVKKFSPYTQITEPNPRARLALRSLIDRSRREKRQAFIFVNNRLEGNAPQTIAAIADD